MLRTISIAMMAAVVLCLSGCKNDSESAVSDMLEKQKDFIAILKNIKDKDSAIAAKPKIEALGKEIGELAKKWDVKKLKDAEMKQAMEKYKPEMEAAQKELQAQMERIVKIPGAGEAISSSFINMAGSAGWGH